MKKKQDPLMLLIYGIILVFVLYFAAGLGTAMDISVNEKGAMDFGKLSENLESTIMNTDLVLSHLTDTETFGFKITLISAIGISLYVLLKSLLRNDYTAKALSMAQRGGLLQKKKNHLQTSLKRKRQAKRSSRQNQSHH